MNGSEDVAVRRGPKKFKSDGATRPLNRKKSANQVICAGIDAMSVAGNSTSTSREIHHIENSSEDDSDERISVEQPLKRKNYRTSAVQKFSTQQQLASISEDTNNLPSNRSDKSRNASGSQSQTRTRMQNGTQSLIRKESGGSQSTSAVFRKPRTPVGSQQLADSLAPLDFEELIQPNLESELAVHSIKLKQIKRFLDEAFNFESSRNRSGRTKTLLIAGPSGGGKSTAIELLCLLRGIELLVWESEFSVEFEDKNSNPDELDLFLRFIRRSHRSFIYGDEHQHLLMISYLPDEAFKNPHKFRSQLKQSLALAHHPIVFCFSNIAAWEVSHRRVFTKEFIRECGIEELNMNPCAAGMLRKAVRRASDAWLGFEPPPMTVNKIIDVANGDIRVAMNILRMCPRGDRRLATQLLETHTKADQDDSFHMMGRILYSKRQGLSSSITQISEWPHDPLERPPTERDVNTILEMSTMAPGRIVEFLHEHHTAFSPNIRATAKILDVISAVDSASAHWETRMLSNHEFQSQTVARAIMYHNYPPKAPKEICQSGIYSFGKPKSWQLEKEISELKEAIMGLASVEERTWMTMMMSNLLRIPSFSIRLEAYDQSTYRLLSEPLRPQWTSRSLTNAFAQMQADKKKRQEQEKKIKINEVTEDDAVNDEVWQIENSSDDSFDDEPIVTIVKKRREK